MDSRGIRGERRRKADAEATNTKNTAKTQLTQRKDKGCFAHTGDQTGPTQPHGEFRLGETYLPKGARAPRRGLVNLVHGTQTRALFNLEGQSHKRLVQLKEIQLNRGLVLGYNPTRYDSLEEGGSLDGGR